jgi:hypothetical protein
VERVFPRAELTARTQRSRPPLVFGCEVAYQLRVEREGRVWSCLISYAFDWLPPPDSVAWELVEVVARGLMRELADE